MGSLVGDVTNTTLSKDQPSRPSIPVIGIKPRAQLHIYLVDGSTNHGQNIGAISTRAQTGAALRCIASGADVARATILSLLITAIRVDRKAAA
ncbi:hypothetical protein DOTSEDRAFT_75886 [Dothistroma septosporum NZE10]|uniref:Uncharacterized protein n=1 Tax=Dothistroma septosporum (strain NZE10 / CBS 128990) TaxID=675120 RepID=N1PBY2_DOTSN|nr:hypothetical protein DOTSEDRAFT_75886 [Dothistroma septosporum NZE10]